MQCICSYAFKKTKICRLKKTEKGPQLLLRSMVNPELNLGGGMRLAKVQKLVKHSIQLRETMAVGEGGKTTFDPPGSVTDNGRKCIICFSH